MRSLALSALAAVLLFFFSACSSPGTSAPADTAAPAQTSTGVQASSGEEEAVKDALRTYLVEVRQMDVAKMSLGLRNLKVEGDSAECIVDFGLKEAPGAPAMSYAYSLSRRDGRWTVASSRPADGTGHGAMPSAGASMPGGHPPVSGASPHGMAAGSSDSTDLPPGHPPVASSESEPPAK